MEAIETLLPTLVEIETATYCNRTCDWCPNSVYDRGQEQNFIKPELFEKIIGDLRDIDYNKDLSLHNYNEPLYDPNIYRYIKMSHDALPQANVMIFTNGDILDAEKCIKLEESGVTTLFITLHYAIGAPDFMQKLEKHFRRISKLVKDEKLYDQTDGYGNKLEATFGRMKIIYYIPFRSTLTSRGGLLTKLNKAPDTDTVCLVPFSCSAIDYEGNVKLCFDIYPAHELHRKNGIIGNLAEKSFRELWFSDCYNDVRRKFLLKSLRNGICECCAKNDIDLETQIMIKGKMPQWKQYLGVPANAIINYPVQLQSLEA
jgi:MoaA/NifB/PqqE/SkfB family radical SAM enzyme